MQRRLRDVTRREAEALVRRALAQEADIDASRFPSRSIAILPLGVATSDSSITALGYGLADLIATDLARTGKLDVVERAQLGALLREIELTESGAVDPDAAPRAGRLLGARHVVGGTLTLLPRARVRIDASVSDVPRTEVIATPAAAASLDAIFDAETQLVFRVLAALNVTLTPAERRLIEQRPTKDVGAFLAYSRGVRDEAHARCGRAGRGTHPSASSCVPRRDKCRAAMRASVSPDWRVA